MLIREFRVCTYLFSIYVVCFARIILKYFLCYRKRQHLCPTVKHEQRTKEEKKGRIHHVFFCAHPSATKPSIGSQVCDDIFSPQNPTKICPNLKLSIFLTFWLDIDGSVVKKVHTLPTQSHPFTHRSLTIQKQLQ